MKKVIVGFVGAAALALVSGAMAGGMTSTVADNGFSDNNAAGVYVGGNLGYGKLDLKNRGTLPQKYLRGFTWNADLGYQFNPYIAVEGEYTHFHDIRVGNSVNNVDASLSGFGLMAKGILPINEKFNVFAKAGAMDMSMTTSLTQNSVTVQGPHSSKIVPAFGIGTSYNLTHHLALTLQGVTTLSASKNISPNVRMNFPATYAAYAGISYKF